MARGLPSEVVLGEWRSIEQSDNERKISYHGMREYSPGRFSLHHGMKLLTIRLHSAVVPTATASSDAATIPA